MKVGDLMRRVPRHCSLSDSLASAGRVMAETGIGVLPVVNDELLVSGVITDRDICCALSQHTERAGELKVSDAASVPAFTCRGEDDLGAALATMRTRGVRRLPVVDSAGRLEGLLSIDEIIVSAQPLAGDAFAAPVYREVLDTLKAILRPAAALAPVA